VRVSVNSIIINGLFDWQKTMHVLGTYVSAIPLEGRKKRLINISVKKIRLGAGRRLRVNSRQRPSALLYPCPSVLIRG